MTTTKQRKGASSAPLDTTRNTSSTEHCWKCGHRWTPRYNRVPKKCPKCANANYDKPAIAGPMAQRSIRNYARAFGMTVKAVRERFEREAHHNRIQAMRRARGGAKKR
jgi:hypothetical protein